MGTDFTAMMRNPVGMMTQALGAKLDPEAPENLPGAVRRIGTKDAIATVVGPPQIASARVLPIAPLPCAVLACLIRPFRACTPAAASAGQA